MKPLDNCTKTDTVRNMTQTLRYFVKAGDDGEIVSEHDIPEDAIGAAYDLSLVTGWGVAYDERTGRIARFVNGDAA